AASEEAGPWLHWAEVEDGPAAGSPSHLCRVEECEPSSLNEAVVASSGRVACHGVLRYASPSSRDCLSCHGLSCPFPSFWMPTCSFSYASYLPSWILSSLNGNPLQPTETI
ncbi:hypothetical protein PENTCL1PPCAC_23520, partial [Pristionchus entomophagus]